YIGTTYGPDPETKKVYQRFGPINGDHGWRRMNVLITRARNKIVVYTSMRSNDIAIAEGNRGRMALKDYLEYIESGHVESVQGTHTGKQPDSPFEESVIKYIHSLGYIAKPQVGVAGFFIDIGVKVEGSYNFVLGVECDGAGYHSSKSARDRDRIRQDILESMGWHIHRIWSTDWFKHRSDEEKRLKKALQEAQKRAILIEQESEIIEPIEQEIVQESRVAAEEETKMIEDIKPVSTDKEDDLLKATLKEFRDTNIASKYTIDYSSILSNRMIELLSETKPTTMEEFRLQIPLYLREKIDRNQMEYIDDIFSLIENNDL
ncbi:MAG: RAP domain-containing protein, partial [Sulfurimonas sp.]